MITRLALIAARIERLDRRKILVILNTLALGIFFFIALRYNYLHPDNMGRLMFATPDTLKYRAIAEWLAGKTTVAPPATLVLPMLYPLLLATVWKVTDNPYVFWGVQFVFWIVATNLVGLAVYRFTKRTVLMVVAFSAMMLNVSAIALTFFALTETVTIFLWSIWLFVLSGTDLRDPEPRREFTLVLLLALLTIVKPIFQLHLVVFLAYVLFSGIRHSHKHLALAVAVLPVVFQILVNIQLYGMATISNLSEATMKWYLLPRVEILRQGTSLDDARMHFRDYDTVQMVSYLARDPVSSSAAFLQDLGENLTGPSDYISFYLKPYIFTYVTSIFYLIAHIAFLPAVFYIFMSRGEKLASAIKMMYLFFLLVVLPTAVSFGEGDRLVITALPLWVVVYCCIPALLRDQAPATQAVLATS